MQFKIRRKILSKKKDAVNNKLKGIQLSSQNNKKQEKKKK